MTMYFFLFQIEFGQDMINVKKTMNHLILLGGCCGTDTRHIDEVCKQL